MNTPAKEWLMQHERAVVAIISRPNWSLKIAEQLYQLKPGELQAFLDAYNGGRRAIDKARLHEIRRELGILAEEKAGAPAVTKPKPLPVAPPSPPATPSKPVDSARNEAQPLLPYLNAERGPQKKARIKYRAALEALVAGTGSNPKDHGFSQFLHKWFGSGSPATADVKSFLALYCNGKVPPVKPASSPEPAQLSVVPKARSGKELEAELERGKQAMHACVHHLHAMGAYSISKAVIVDHVLYEVTVAKQVAAPLATRRNN